MPIMFSSERFNSPRMVEEFGKFLVGQLDHHELTRDNQVGETFRTQQQALVDLLGEEKELGQKLQSFERELYWVEDRFYDGLRDFHHAVLSRSDFDRSVGLYRRYFPQGLSRLGKITIEGQNKIVAQWIDQVGRDELPEIDDPSWSRLVDLHRDLAQVLEEMAGVKDDLSRLQRVEKHLREDWAAAYRETFHELMLVFGQRRRKVYRFFKQVKASKKKREEPEVPVEMSGATSEGEGVVD